MIATRTLPVTLLALVIGCTSAAAGERTLRIESSAQRVSLLELFTSEGCSSCPPADRWLSGLESDPRLWRSLVPVAFHVDYWDHIGWPDRFASPDFSNRQRAHARQGGIASVYTPGFVVDGSEWRRWFRNPELELGAPTPAGVIRIAIEFAGGRVTARYTAAQVAPQALDLHLAILGFDLRTEVAAGENGGRTLEHDFVVLGYGVSPMTGASPLFAADTRLPAARIEAPRRAVAAWVSERGSNRPLQAAGGWLE